MKEEEEDEMSREIGNSSSENRDTHTHSLTHTETDAYEHNTSWRSNGSREERGTVSDGEGEKKKDAGR